MYKYLEIDITFIVFLIYLYVNDPKYLFIYSPVRIFKLYFLESLYINNS